MNLHKMLERLYGLDGAVQVDPASIPCNETSNPDALCKAPLVSVRLITYNHEPYIQKCLDSVLSQKTDFEYEVVVGEDCSQDRTRAICLEYQKCYPEKVRVLWSDENLHHINGNHKRTEFHCRGKYIALLEGDDYWTDPLKLQKQIDLIRATDSIGCVANYATLHVDGRLLETRYCSGGFITHNDMSHFYPHTSTYVFQRDFINRRQHLYPRLHAWYDVILMHCLIETGKVAHLQDVVSVYRLTGAGVATSMSGQEKKILAIKQYLDLYLNGPKSWHKRFGALVLTYIAYFFNRSTLGWSKEYTKKYASDFKRAFWTIYWRQPFDLRTIRALMRYLRFRAGMTK